MVNKLRKMLKNEKGFTLVELLAVIVILGIIAAIAVPSIGKIIDNSKLDAHVSNARQMIEASRLYVVSENVDTSGDTEKEILLTRENDSDNALVDDGYLENIPEDPTGSEYSAGKVFVKQDGENLEYRVYLEGEEHVIGDDSWEDAIKLSELDRDEVTPKDN